MKKIRAFIAIEIPIALKDALEEAQHELRTKTKSSGHSSERDIKWTKPEALHLTLKFLGTIDLSKVTKIDNALQEACSSIKSFELKAHGLGSFPPGKTPHTVWTGINTSSELAELFGKLEEGLEKLDFKKEHRPFSPHLTLCRVKTKTAGKSLTSAVESILKKIDYSFHVSELVLFQSELTPKGAIHTPLTRVKLKK